MNGVTFTHHASERLAERNIWIEQAIELLANAHRIYPTNKYHSNSIQFWKNKEFVFIVNADKKKVITVYKRYRSLFK